MKKSIVLILCAFIFILTATACSRQSSVTENKSGTLLENTGVSHDLQSYESRITAKLSSGVQVDANVIIPANTDFDSLVTGRACLITQDFNYIKQILIGDKEITEELSDINSAGVIPGQYHYCATEDGFILATTGENIFFAGDLSNKINLIFDETENGNSEVFATKKDLDFMPIVDAEQVVQDILQQLNISVVTEPMCYTFDFEGLSLEAEKYNLIQKIEWGETSPNIIFESKDECYLFEYQLLAGTLPVSTHQNGVFGDGSWTPGTSVRGIYSKDGVISLELGYQFQFINIIDQEQGLVVEDVLSLIDAKYHSLILEGDYLINKIEFEYVPFPQNDDEQTYIFIPVWRISVLQSYTESDKMDSGHSLQALRDYTIAFNAITGNELAIDSGAA